MDEEFRQSKAELIRAFRHLSQAYDTFYSNWEKVLPEDPQTKAIFDEAKNRFREISEQERRRGTESREDVVTNQDLHSRIHELLSIIKIVLLDIEQDQFYLNFNAALEAFKEVFKNHDGYLKDYLEDYLYRRVGTSDRLVFLQKEHIIDRLKRAYDVLIDEHKKRIEEMKQERNAALWFEERMVLEEGFEDMQLNKYEIYSTRINYHLSWIHR